MKNLLTFKEIASHWEDEKRAYVKRSTLSIYSVHLRKHLLPSFGERTSLSENDVQSFVNEKLQSGLLPKTIKDILVVLHMILLHAAKYFGWEYRPMDIHFPTPRVHPHLQVLSLAQQKRLMHYLFENFSYFNLGLSLCLETGLRIGEICALTWGDIDLDAGVVHITKTIQRIYLGQRKTEVIVDTPKTAHSYRDIPLPANLITQLKPLKRQATDRHYVLTNDACPLEPGPYRNYFKRLMKRLGFPPIRFHALRHSFATRCIECGCDYKTVSALLGHANINTTLNLYVHPSLDHKKKCVNEASLQLE